MRFLEIFSTKKPKKREALVSSAFPLSEAGFRELVLSVEEKEIRPRLPDLAFKKVLEISPRQKPMTALLKEKGAKITTRVGGTKEMDLGIPVGESFILSHWESLPFLDKAADMILLRLAFLKGGFGRILREVGRILNPQGFVILSDFHPFSQMVQKEHLKNPVGEEGLGPGFERYIKWFREAGFKFEWVKESFFEGTMKKFFVSDEEIRQFEQLRRTPFLVFFLLKKE